MESDETAMSDEDRPLPGFTTVEQLMDSLGENLASLQG